MEREKLIAVVSAAQRGDHAALNELFNAYYNDVYYFALKTLKDEDLACDITQETFVKIIDSIATLSEPAAFVTWMKQITYHQCLNHFKLKKEILVDEDEDGNTIFDTLAEDRTEFIPGEALDQQDFRKTILAMLDRLSPEQRAATMLFYYNEFSVRQVAQIQGVSEGTVKSRLNYARKAIKASVEAYEKQHNIKLHSFGLFPFMVWLFSGAESATPAASAASVAAGISTITGTSIVVSGTLSTAAGTSVAVASAVSATTGTGFFSGLSAIPLAVKIAVATVAGIAVIGGVGAAVRHEASPVPIPPTPTITEEITTLPPTDPPSSASTPTETIPEETAEPTQVPTEPLHTTPTETTPPETEPEETVPEATEPEVTEPEATEPEVTEPEETEPEATEPSDIRYVPAGCTYILADGTAIPAGDPMPATVSPDDQFITPDYTYVYTSNWLTGNTMGWGVTVIDTGKTSYESLRSEINGKPLVGLGLTFMGCSNMVTAPAIPSTVRTLDRAFYGCSALTQAPAIPSGVWNMSQAFASCTSLQASPVIPGGVTNLWKAFYGCESLTVPPAIPGGVTDLYETFKYCTSLQSAPAIPAGVTNMTGTFAQCWSLGTAPAIPAAVNVMDATFSGCSSLSGTVTIHATPAYYQNCFSGTQNPITLTGSGTNLAELAATGTTVSVAAE